MATSSPLIGGNEFSQGREPLVDVMSEEDKFKIFVDFLEVKG
ncbi:hypothetical protein [Methanothrix sp.]|nr:hypothetical protein [Methanothrix sp.]